jgi:hypothetical protein
MFTGLETSEQANEDNPATYFFLEEKVLLQFFYF